MIRLCVSVGAKSLNDVDARGAQGRQRRRNNCGREQQDCRDNYGQSTGHFHVEEIAAGQTRHQVAECPACKDARRSHDGPFYHDASEEIPWLRSQGQPDAEFTGARADGKRQHASDANQCNRQRDGREHAEHQRVQTVGRKHLRADVFESGRVLDGLIGGHAANDARDRSDERIGIYGGMDEQVTCKDGTLFDGGIDGDGGLRNDVYIVDIGGDADDAVGRDAKPGDKFQPGDPSNRPGD